MASQGDTTRVGGGAPPPQPPPPSTGESIDLTTLVISAIASAAAAYLTSKIWARGTLVSAAMTPVIVALVKEGLRRPTEKVATVVPAVVTAPSRWTRTSASEPGLVPEEPPPVAPAPVDPDAPHVVLPPVVGAEAGPVRVYSTRARRLRWRLAVITGLLGFLICVALYTVPELIAGKSIGRGSSNATTIFGGRSHHTKKSDTTTTSPASTTQTTSTAPTTTTQTAPSATTPSQTTTQPQASTPSSAAPAAPSSATPAPSSTAPGTAAPQAAPAP
jgi:hypothetical protein